MLIVACEKSFFAQTGVIPNFNITKATFLYHKEKNENTKDTKRSVVCV